MKDQLYLLQPGFHNAGLGPMYCSDSAPVEGVLSFFPQLRQLVDVHYLEFPRPRAELINLLGQENQGLPVLVLAENQAIKDTELAAQSAHGRKFFSDEKSIRHYLSTQ
jgi:hypothetical protein